MPDRPDPTEYAIATEDHRDTIAPDHATTAFASPRAGSPTRAMIGLSGTTLDADERVLLRAMRPAGVFLFRRNIVDPGQLRRLADAIRAEAGPDTLIAIDQEGGRVARLRPPHFLAHPAAGTIDSPRAAWLTGAMIGLEAAAHGLDMVSAPVLDRAVAAADAVIGDRAYRGVARTVAELGRAMAEGLAAAGVIPIGKHVPGHGRALADSHLDLPVLDDIDADDLLPFTANRDLPCLMTAHIAYRALDDAPATCSPRVIRTVVRDRIGFDGLLITDDLAMRALSGTPAERTARALAAGCDLALHCPGGLADSRAVCEAAGPAPAVTLARLDRARHWVAARRQDGLDLPMLAAERRALPGATA